MTLLDVVCCPACKASLTAVEIARSQALICKACQTVFPAAEEIPILLPHRLRDRRTEGPLLEALAVAAEGHGRKTLALACRQTMRRLTDQPDEILERQVERHWSAVYAARAAEPNVNDRAWICSTLFRRELSHLYREPPLRVIEVGCGDGVVWRRAFATILPDTLHYIGVDLSVAGMSRARQHRTGATADYLVATADELPFRDEVADIVVCHESLYTTRWREATIPALLRLLRPGGRLICIEPLRRPGTASLAPLDPVDLHAVLSRLGGAIILDVLTIYGTTFYRLAMQLGRALLQHSRPAFMTAFNLDRLLARSGKRSGSRRPSRVGFLLRKR